MRDFEPHYNLNSINGGALLHEAPARVQIGAERFSGRGEVRLELLPRGHIYCYAYLDKVPMHTAVKTMFEVESASFYLAGQKIEGFRVGGGGNAKQGAFVVKWLPNVEPICLVGDDATAMSRVVFHLFNFGDFAGARHSVEKKNSGVATIHHMDLGFDDWVIEIKSLPSTIEVVRRLREEGGSGLTHVGCIAKRDGKVFTGGEAQGILGSLRNFLTFAKGARIEPVCAVGSDKSEQRIWELWSSPCGGWSRQASWFDVHNASQLEVLFPLFMAKQGVGEWREALRELIYWYRNSCDDVRGIDAGIILTQAAIERLAYEYVVKDKKLLTDKGFKDLRASDKFRIIFSSLGVPIDIPAETSKMESKGKALNWLDAPHALTEVRNSLVHPDHKRRDELSPLYFEAWNLGLWFLEMGILAVCGYAGTYGNRLKSRTVGEVDPVPWS